MACLSLDAVGHSQTGVLSGLGEDGAFLLLYRFLHQPHSSGFTLQESGKGLLPSFRGDAQFLLC